MKTKNQSSVERRSESASELIEKLSALVSKKDVVVEQIKPKEEPKTEQAAPAPVIVNVQQNQENKQKVENGGGTHVIERVVEKPAASQPAQAQPKKEEESW
jgi:Rod binding domain-containing protein